MSRNISRETNVKSDFLSYTTRMEMRNTHAQVLYGSVHYFHEPKACGKSTSEITPYFTMTKCLITFLFAELNAIRTLSSSIYEQ